MSMKKHITLVCDNKGCNAHIHTGKEKNYDARMLARHGYGWATAPDYPKGSGGRQIDLCPECKYVWVRPGESAPMYERLKPWEVEAIQTYQQENAHVAQ